PLPVIEAKATTAREPVRVVHVVPSLEPGGLENGLVNIIGLADARAVSHSVICLERAGSFASRLPAGVPLVAIGKRPGRDLRALAATALAARELGAQVVHTRNWASLVEGALAARVARARHVHGL